MSDHSAHKILILGASLFASWTALCYLMVFAGGSFIQLLQWSPIAFAAGLIVAWLCLDNRDTGDRLRFSQKMPVTRGRAPLPTWGLLVYLASFLVLYRLNAPWISLWGIQLICSALVLYCACHRQLVNSDRNRCPDSAGNRIALIALMLLGSVVTLVTHRPDIDDAQYLNFVVTAMDFPQEALYSRSGLWPDPSMPLEYPIYRFHSYELLVAALSQITGFNHQTLYYLALPALFSAAAVLVHWQLARYLLPHRAISVVIIWLTLIIALGETHRAFGNFAFVRLFQGKSLLVTLALPFCLLLGLRFAEAPQWRRALALGTAIVCCMGLSSSALVTMPVIVAATGTAALLQANRRTVKFIIIVAVAFAASLAPIVIFILSNTALGDGLYGGIQASTSNGLAMVLGDGIPGLLVLILFPLAPLFVESGRRSRIYAAITLVYVLILLNPWTAPYLARMFDLALQWRIFWALPLLLSAALTLGGLSYRVLARWPQIPPAVTLCVFVISILFSSSRWSLSTENGVTIGAPGYKVAPFEHTLARDIVDDAPGRPAIYAPVSLSAWITTFRNHPYPAFVRIDYFNFSNIQQHAGMNEINRRKRLFDILEGHDEYDSVPAFLREQLVRDKPRYVVYPHNIAMAPIIGAVLAEAGYKGQKRGPYAIWRSAQ